MRRSLYTLLLSTIILLPQIALAADHTDGPRASADPSADITDVFAWMSPDASDVYLVMDLVRNASTASRFSDSVLYVFRTTSQAEYGSSKVDHVDVICEFDADQKVSCWVGDADYVTGDASATKGLVAADGRMKVFTGLRNDPFFFNLSGFRETARIVTGAASSLTFDAAGCPALDAATSSALVSQLQHSASGGAAVDDFANFNVLSIALAVDKTLLTTGGPIVSVSASTFRK